MPTVIHRLWCDTDTKYEYVQDVDTSVPTVCPTDSGHSIDSSKDCIVETVSA